ncbi:hypothetical protein J4399_00260 [Candidatus Woesearchaeota archaeon]|nr:hypothetical protein [Candidatus Woesearchaeota archaeon]HIH54226.1 hypothetical protein [Candidatus Woesearchaeota archaeon]HIJ02201.1 hypothetical protein [Candidatus Woesearchaeota archaeon]HIJ13926.1 hypothetical protein [Candidatus Woesearchaeota archaeon]
MDKKSFDETLLQTIIEATINGLKSGKDWLGVGINIKSNIKRDITNLLEDYFKQSEYELKKTENGETLNIFDKEYQTVSFNSKYTIPGIHNISLKHLPEENLELMLSIGNEYLKYHSVKVILQKLNNKYKFSSFQYIGSVYEMSRTTGQMHKITDFGTLKMSSFSSDRWHDC